MDGAKSMRSAELYTEIRFSPFSKASRKLMASGQC